MIQTQSKNKQTIAMRYFILSFLLPFLALPGLLTGCSDKAGPYTSPPAVIITANPTSVAPGNSSQISWSSTQATVCKASGSWFGKRPVSGSETTRPLTNDSRYTLTCEGAGGSKRASVTISVSPQAPTLSLEAAAKTAGPNETVTLTWRSGNTSNCTASGAWSGSRPSSGSESTGPLLLDSTFHLNCTGTAGSIKRSVTVRVPPMPLSGLDFPGSAAVPDTLRFRFLNPLPIYPATYIWRAYPRQQDGYYTAFFWGNDDGKGTLDTFLWKSGIADSYYGAHPYPDPPPNGSKHNWEISIEQDDFQNGRVIYDRWYTQALVVWGDENGKHHVFYWDLPNTDASHRVTRDSPRHWGETQPPVPTLTWGDAPWAPGNEVWNGILRGIRVYTTNLTLEEILKEAELPLSTAAGAASIWYMNMNPTPTDISDKSGQGHDPQWVGSRRPSLWTEK